ncbi:MAG: asparagine synthase (glutamine-hydrolyzing) [Verrucomicrobiaceae bacterium]|nr:asparagine synthase (glutamine-hydrolyzing) [Verrucomicrobiaceae bacterium]
MCGIVGSYHQKGEAQPPALLRRMTEAMSHRGPDGEGFFFANTISGTHDFADESRRNVERANLAFGHRRLAILDLSAAGRQPMVDASGSFAITYNGEIYNHLEIRRELEAQGVKFFSRTDTETVLQAYAMWGDACVERFNGMFAFAIWDRPGRRLFLARDRFGVKPLYYAAVGDSFVFGSEIKAMLPHPALSRRVCAGALDEYFTFQNVLTDRTLFDGVHLLPAGHLLSIDLRETAASGGVAGRITRRQYWDYSIPKQPLDITLDEAAEETRRLFVRAVERQLMSDVPVGAYLSGGMDSGSIVAIASREMKSRGMGRFHSFTGGFDMSSASGLEMGCDERQSAEVLANLFKTEHYENVLHAGDMEHVMPELIWHLEDLRVGQCYPNYYTSRLASKFVKVCLAGSGGDELFAGYPWRYYQAIAGGGASFLESYYRFWQRLVPDAEKPALLRDAARNEAGAQSSFDIFKGVIAGLGRAAETAEDCVNLCLYFELKTFLNGLLVVDDKVSMAHSMETRVPFLDNDLADFALRLPVNLKLKNLAARVTDGGDENDVRTRSSYEVRTHDGKMVLRQAMHGLVPLDTVERTKQGFSAPDASWFRGESIDYIDRLLLREDARIYDYLQPAYVRAKIKEHEAGKANHRLFIWSVLSFEWWCRKFLDGAA